MQRVSWRRATRVVNVEASNRLSPSAWGCPFDIYKVAADADPPSLLPATPRGLAPGTESSGTNLNEADRDCLELPAVGVRDRA